MKRNFILISSFSLIGLLPMHIYSLNKGDKQDEVAQAQRGAFRDVDDQFNELQRTGTPESEEGPIPIDMESPIINDQ